LKGSVERVLAAWLEVAAGRHSGMVDIDQDHFSRGQMDSKISITQIRRQDIHKTATT